MSENQDIEYKSSWRNEYLRWICGFANTQSGTLYIGNERAEYGTQLLKYLSERLTHDFGKGFDERQFYLTFPIRDALRPELGRTHYRLVLRVHNNIEDVSAEIQKTLFSNEQWKFVQWYMQETGKTLIWQQISQKLYLFKSRR